MSFLLIAFGGMLATGLVTFLGGIGQVAGYLANTSASSWVTPASGFVGFFVGLALSALAILLLGMPEGKHVRLFLLLYFVIFVLGNLSSGAINWANGSNPDELVKAGQVACLMAIPGVIYAVVLFFLAGKDAKSFAIFATILIAYAFLCEIINDSMLISYYESLKKSAYGSIYASEVALLVTTVVTQLLLMGAFSASLIVALFHLAGHDAPVATPAAKENDAAGFNSSK